MNLVYFKFYQVLRDVHYITFFFIFFIYIHCILCTILYTFARMILFSYSERVACIEVTQIVNMCFCQQTVPFYTHSCMVIKSGLFTPHSTQCQCLNVHRKAYFVQLMWFFYSFYLLVSLPWTWDIYAYF